MKHILYAGRPIGRCTNNSYTVVTESNSSPATIVIYDGRESRVLSVGLYRHILLLYTVEVGRTSATAVLPLFLTFYS